MMTPPKRDGIGDWCYPALCLPLLAAWLCGSSLAHAATPFDLVIQNGRVIDPESQLDAVRSIGIRDGRVAAISNKPLDAAQVIDAAGLVVSPVLLTCIRTVRRRRVTAWSCLTA